jgi:propane monooxygenase large subunit
MVPQPHLELDDPKQLWTVDHFKGIPFASPNITLNEMSPEEREKHMAEYRRGGPAGRRAPAGA